MLWTFQLSPGEPSIGGSGTLLEVMTALKSLWLHSIFTRRHANNDHDLADGVKNGARKKRFLVFPKWLASSIVKAALERMNVHGRRSIAYLDGSGAAR
jgi:hypothetical protein